LIEELLSESRSLGAPSRPGLDRLRIAVATALQGIEGTLDRRKAIVRRAWRALLGRARRSDIQNPAGWFMAAVTACESGAFADELRSARNAEEKRVSTDLAVQARQVAASQPYTPPPSNLMEMLRTSIERNRRTQEARERK
jgi:hypothetical protein